MARDKAASLQPEWPALIPLFSITRPRREGREPADVQSPDDLPSHLILGDLDPDRFQRTPTGWTATWSSPVAPHFARGPSELQVEYRGPAQASCATLTFWGELVGQVFVHLGKWSDLARQIATGMPDTLLRVLAAGLEETRNVRVLRPAGAPVGFGLPDGPMLLLMQPLPVQALRRACDLRARLRKDPRIGAGVHGLLATSFSVVNYITGKSQPPVAELREVDRWTVETTGMLPFAHASREQGSDGTSALTVRRCHYNLLIECFLRDVPALIDHLVVCNLTSTSAPDPGSYAHPTAPEWGCLVLPGTLAAVEYELAVWDAGRTRRLVFDRVLDEPEAEIWQTLPERELKQPGRLVGLAEDATRALWD